MLLIEMLTVNEENEGRGGLIEIIWRALEYFPEGLWGGIKYLGNVSMRNDVNVRSREAIYGAFLFNNLIERVRKVRELLQVKNLLLTVTRDPIVAIYHKFEFEKFSRVVSLVHDYVSKDIGVISLFRIEVDEMAPKIIAHGLGHNKGLRHHLKPIDIMYDGLLLEHNTLRNDGFCWECLKKMEDKKNI